jgi:hypothetical protein
MGMPPLIHSGRTVRLCACLPVRLSPYSPSLSYIIATPGSLTRA